MALLTGAITYLALSGVPGLPPGDFDKSGPPTYPRPDDGQFTALQVNGVSGKPRTYTGKAEETNIQKFVFDTWIPRFTLSSVGDVDIDVTDLWVPRLTLSAFVQTQKTVSDTWVPRVTLAYTSLVKSGTINKPVSDTWVPRVTLTASLSRSVGVTDTWVPVLTLAQTVTKSAVLEVSDTWVPVLELAKDSLTIVAGNVLHQRSDTWVPRLALSAVRVTSGEVDRIRVTGRSYGRIKITLR